ncbi:cryptochrome/photolyase family protein [Lacinutrix jangbogonensis]|uniref:cryptochrome/photolyase family protein n=1 Tax=Lacinutrix jangbogonensis TaxID=1469557 RepID=UPI00053EC986|nr:deoxyribodipyrimidine photo-lyase [Lacinutrix jangbogonensis]
MKASVNIFWFRRDLRLEDNHGFYEALNSDKPVLPIFIFDEDILNKLPKMDARVTFIHENLKAMQAILKREYNSNIAIFHGKPETIYKQLIESYTIDSVYTNRDYEPYALARDNHIKVLLTSHKINFKTFKDQVIFERNEIVKKDGTAYKVYTPFSRLWIDEYKRTAVTFFPSEELLPNTIKSSELPNLSLEAIGFKEAKVKVKHYTVTPTLIADYEATRNFPSQDNTSKLGPHLRFGTVSVRKMVNEASKQQNITFLKELIWREFFMQILWHFPHTAKDSFKPKYDRIEWSNNETEFNAWCEGNTGYPLVDAGMRQLNATGFMHNRVRMLVGSFLCKHLLIDWRLGEAYFALKLHDYDMSSNIGNWQWVAGCGVDAAPYFRIFNPTTQIEKFDKQHDYIKKWVPEYQELTYPTPIVDHKAARERCLRVYKAAVS